MSKILRLCLIQPASPAGDVGLAFATLERGAAVAAAAGADIAVLPELLLPGYNSGRIPDLAQPADGEWTLRATEIARQSGVMLVYGYAEREGGQCYNSAIAIGPDGAVLARYRKVQLYGPRENALFSPGSALCEFVWRGRRIALLICYDIEFAPHVAALTARGVDVILVPTANMAPYTHVCRLTVPAQAVMHGVAIAYANYAGPEGDLTYCGESVIVNADGRVLAAAGAGEAVLIADLTAPDPVLLSTQGKDFRPLG